MDEWVVAGVTLVGGLTVVVLVVQTLFFKRGGHYRYEVPRAGANGGGFTSEAGAVEAAGRAIDEMTEVD